MYHAQTYCALVLARLELFACVVSVRATTVCFYAGELTLGIVACTSAVADVPARQGSTAHLHGCALFCFI